MNPKWRASNYILGLLTFVILCLIWSCDSGRPLEPAPTPDSPEIAGYEISFLSQYEARISFRLQDADTTNVSAAFVILSQTGEWVAEYKGEDAEGFDLWSAFVMFSKPTEFFAAVNRSDIWVKGPTEILKYSGDN